MNLRHLRYFVAIAEEKSFLRAAERLHVSQPPLSTQIKSLEQALSVKLFDRSPRGVELTSAGEVFLLEARAILARVEHARISAQRADRGEQGVLSIGFVSTASYGVLPPALKAFRSRYPGVDIQLHELTTDRQCSELSASRLDIGLALAPVEEPGIQFDPITDEYLMLAVPESHTAAAKNAKVSLREFSKDDFIIPPRAAAPGLYETILTFCRECGFVPKVTQVATQMQTIISLVSAGLGVALVPESLHHIQRSGVRYLSLKEPGPSIVLGAIYRRESLTPVTKRFLEVLSQFRKTGSSHIGDKARPSRR